MAETVTISRGRYEAAVEAGQRKAALYWITNPDRSAVVAIVEAAFATAGIEVERTPEQRLAELEARDERFRSDIEDLMNGRGEFARLEFPLLAELTRVITRHFPGVRLGG